MAPSYSVKLLVSCWKEVECAGCQARFRYRMRCRASATGTSEDIARVAAEHDALRHCETRRVARPCPSCGVIQPSMVEHARRRLITVALMCGLLTVAGALVAGLAHLVDIPTSVHLATAATLFLLITQWAALAFNPNRKLDRNRRIAQRGVQKGSIVPQEAETVVSGVMPPQLRPGLIQRWGILFLASTVLVAYAPEALRMIKGWKSNSGCYPNVFGPNDRVTVYAPKKVQAVDQMWRGEAKGRIVRPAELRSLVGTMDGQGRNSRWGRDITGRRVANRATRLWATLSVPDEEQLEHQRLELQLVLTATFPREVGQMGLPEGRFEEKTERQQWPLQVHLAERRSGAAYAVVWRLGQCFILAVVATVGLLFVGMTRTRTRDNSRVYLTPKRETRPERKARSAPRLT